MSKYVGTLVDLSLASQEKEWTLMTEKFNKWAAKAGISCAKSAKNGFREWNGTFRIPACLDFYKVSEYINTKFEPTGVGVSVFNLEEYEEDKGFLSNITGTYKIFIELYW